MSNIKSFEEARNELTRFYGKPNPGPYTLDAMRQLMDHLGNPQDSFKTVHIAGTSGKTSTAYYVAALLTASGHKTGLTVSPHVREINERVQFDMQPQPEVKFCKALSKFLKLVDESTIKPSYFELMVAFAYWQFAREKVDYAVVEVGLGGLLDGTNVVSRSDKLCIITDIGLDHTDILGDTLAKIAEQKAGIILPENHVFMLQQPDEVMNSVAATAQPKRAMVHVVPDKSATVPGSDLPLFQQRNIWLAAYAANYVLLRDIEEGLSTAAINAAAKTAIPARMETLQHGGKTIILDGAHNNQKISVLLESIAAKYPGERITAMAGFVDGPDDRWQGGLDALQPHVQNIIVTSFASAQDMPKYSVNPERIAEYCDQHNITAEIIADPAEAFERLLRKKADIYLVVGSFYMLNHVYPVLTQKLA